MANEFIARNGVIAQNDSQVTGSLIVTNGITGSLFGTSSWAVNAITANTASYILNATSASFAATGSYADNFTVKNTLTAQTLVVSVVSSSVVYSSGSNIFGNSLTDTQKFTGSVQITGSLSVNGTTATLGTGTINTVPKFTAVNTIGNSNITDNGTLITLNTGSYVNGNLSIGTATIPFGEKLFIQGDASAASAVLTTSANSGISTLSVNVDRGLQGGVNIIADKTNQLGIIRVNNSDFWPLVFQVRGADGTIERMRITNIGSVGIGATSLGQFNLRISKNITGSSTSYSTYNDGVVQSTVGTAIYNGTAASTAAASFTLNELRHFFAQQGTFGAGSTVTNQYGFLAESTLIGATNNYGFYGNIASGTNRWNIYMNGTALNYMAGTLGIGTTSLTGHNLRVSKNLTGATSSYGFYNSGAVQSDVTTAAYYNATVASTAAASFTLGTLIYNYANQGTFGAGSTVNLQVGYYAESTLIGAGTNYGFQGAIPVSGSSNWNLFMNGTAPNHLAGSLGIGTTSLVSGGGTYNLNLAKNITGTVVAGGMSIGGSIQSDVTSAAVGLNVQLNTAASSFTLSQLRHISVNEGTIGAGSVVNNQYGIYVDQITKGTSNYAFFGNTPVSGSRNWNIYMDGSAPNFMAGNLGIGTTSLTGYELRVGANITGATTAYGIAVDGTIQSDVTSTALIYTSRPATAAASFNLGTLGHYYVTQGTLGAGSTIGTQVGFWVSSGLTNATTNYAFYSLLAAGTGRWNLYMEGTANNYMAGALGIGSTSVGSGINLNMAKTMTGATTQWNIYNQSQIQSDVTVYAAYYRTNAATQAATFTLTDLVHYATNQGTFGAGSTVTNQYGFVASGTMLNATNNYGFYGGIASGTNRWNLYMAGTATNYLAGALGVGNTGLTGYNLRISLNPSAAASYGIMQDGTALSSVTASYHINRTLAQTQAAAFTLTELVHYYATQGTFGAGSTVTNQYGFIAGANLIGASSNFGFYGAINSGTNRWNLYMAGTANNYLAGRLGIGVTAPTSTNVALNLNITGGGGSNGFYQLGVVQSDVTSTAYGYRNLSATQAASFTLPDYFHFAALQGSFGAGSTVTNQYGFHVDSSLTGATNDFGFYGNLGASANVWNLYMNGTANNYLAGALGIGSTSMATVTLRLSKNITGGTIAYGLYSDGQVQTDVTSTARNFQSVSNLAASVSVGGYNHFRAGQGTFGLGAAITNAQVGFFADAGLVGGANNYGFQGSIPVSGSRNWNLYMDGTANNYLAGKLVIGTTTVPGSTLGIANNTEFSINLANIGTGGLSWQIASTSNTFAAGAGKLIFTYDGLSVNSLLTLEQATKFVGINNNFPSYSLDVSGSIRAIPSGFSILLGGSASGPVLDFGTVANPSQFGSISHRVGEFRFDSTSRPYNFFMNSTSSLYIGTNRFVGINKTTPSASLDVSGSVLITGSLDVTNGITGSLFGTASYATQAATASYFVTSSVTSASYAETSSYADNFTVANQLTATTLVVQTISSSVVYSSGSNVFGNSLSNTQQFTGSVTITGSLGVNTTNVTRTLTVNGSIFAGGVTTYNKSYNSLDTTGVAVAGLSAGANGDSALFTFTCFGGFGYQRIVYSCRNESTTWRTSKTIDEGANAFDVLASVDGATITFTFRGRSALQQFRPSVIIEASGNSIDTTYL